jgi:hypothetical protein
VMRSATASAAAPSPAWIESLGRSARWTCDPTERAKFSVLYRSQCRPFIGVGRGPRARGYRVQRRLIGQSRGLAPFASSDTTGLFRGRKRSVQLQRNENKVCHRYAVRAVS